MATSQEMSSLGRLVKTEEEEPTLVGQLRLLRHEYGEASFDSEIAKPLATALQKLTQHFIGERDEAEGEARELQDKLDEIEQTGEESAVKAGAYDELLDDLSDVPRGIRTLEEIMDKHPLEASV